MKKALVVYDVETYPNYFLIRFKRLKDNKKLVFEARGLNARLNSQECTKIKALFKNNKIFGFNSDNFDAVITSAAVHGLSCKALNKLAIKIIEGNLKGWMAFREFNLVDYCKGFDIMEVIPGVRIPLKMYGARVHFSKLQELPIEPGSLLTNEQMDVISKYCDNDCELTEFLFNKIQNAYKLRIEMSKQYNINLLSKSDAQIAEAVIKSKLIDLQVEVKRPDINPDTYYRYTPPDYINFNLEILKDTLHLVSRTDFYLDGKGSIALPQIISKNLLSIGLTKYKIGVGGLHSQEKQQAIVADDEMILADLDVASYYPNIILNNNYYPKHLGKNFLTVYKTLVEERLKAKAEGNETVNAALKVTINGSYGKLGSKYSVLYSPDLLLHVTLTGQLSLLMLIEKMEENGIKVLSANTDGIIVYFNKSNKKQFKKVWDQWESTTGLTLESTYFKARYARDVNNYIAIKHDKTWKGKGIFTMDTLTKNPTGNIVQKAVIEYLINNTPLEFTIKNNKNLNDFLIVRRVTGGAIYKNKEIGKIIRWVYIKDSKEVITYKKNGNRVPLTEGAYPVMDLNDMPNNIDYSIYVYAAKKMLTSLGI